MWLSSWLRNRPRPAIQRKRPSCRLTLEALEDRCLLSGGVLDPTFGNGGIVHTLPPLDAGLSYAVTTYPQDGTANDGKIVAAGWAEKKSGIHSFAVLRYNLNGTLDTGFGSSGQVVGPQGDGHAVAIQPLDGKIVAAGFGNNGSYTNFAVVRYNPNGTLDSTFGKNGVAYTALSSKGTDRGFAMVLQSDGKIVVAGDTTPANSTTPLLALVRYNTNGSLDTSFGNSGKVVSSLAVTAPGMSHGIGLAIDPATGEIVVEASTPPPPSTQAASPSTVVCFTSNGSLDTSFNGTGSETFTNLVSDGAVAVQASNHRIIIAGNDYATANQTLVRLNPDGTLDGTFGAGGMVVTNIGGLYERSVKFQADGSILVGATTRPSTSAIVTRYNSSDGSLDSSFGVNGVASVTYQDANSSGVVLAALALEPDGRITVLGNIDSGMTQWIVARLLATGPQIGSFAASPNPVTSGTSTTLTASNITDGNPNAAITQVVFYYYDSTGAKQVLGYGTQTSPGAWTLSFTVNLTPGTYTLFSQAEDGYGVFGDPTTLTLTVA